MTYFVEFFSNKGNYRLGMAQILCLKKQLYKLSEFEDNHLDTIFRRHTVCECGFSLARVFRR